MQTSRGCPRACEFCAASLRITSGFQQKPVALATAEIAAALDVIDEPFIELADDNSFINGKWSKEFVKSITP